MTEQPPTLKRGVLGYRRSAVDRTLADRDLMLTQAEARVQAAEARASRLESEVAGLREQQEKLEARLADLQEGGFGAEPGPSITTRFLNEELATILGAAEESATRIIERARQATQQQVAEAERVWREAQSQISRFASWRERVDPALRSAQSKIEDARTRIDEVPERIRQALAPLADAIALLDGNLADVTSTVTPPLLVAPTGVRTAAGADVQAEAPGESATEHAPSEAEQRPDDAAAGAGPEPTIDLTSETEPDRAAGDR